MKEYFDISDLFTFWNTIIKEKNEGTWLGFKSLADFSLNNPDHIKELIKRQPLTQLKRFTDTSGRNKAQVVEAVYNRIIDLFNISGNVQWSFGQKYSDVIREKINSQTETDFNNYIEGKRQAKKENEKALTDPETLDEFRTFLQEKKISDLTDEQLTRYDALVAGKMKEMNQRQESRGRTIEAVDLGGIDFELKETIHTRKNIPLYVVVLSGRVEKGVFKELSAKAKQLDGHYSSFSREGAIPGFQFQNKESAEKFMQLKESAVDNSEEWEKKQFDKAGNRAEALRNKANSLIYEGNSELSMERKDNTHRRAAMAKSAEQRASSKIRSGNTLLRIAEGIEDGSVEWLSKVTSITELQLLFSLLNRAKWERIRKENLNSDEVEVDEKVIRYVVYPYPSFWTKNLVSALEKVEDAPGRKRDAVALLKGLKKRDPEKVVYITDQYYIDKLHVITEPYGDKFSKWEALNYKEQVLDYNRIKRLDIDNISQLRTALRELIKISSGRFISKEQEAELKLKELERSFIGKKIDGFFPTPMELAEEIVDRADIQPGEIILEPNGGLGHVAEVIRTKYSDNPLIVVEVNSMLVDALKFKGFDVVHEDFLEYNPEEKFDKIIMNPPFEKNQDIDHVYHAYSLLKPGGRIVAVMAGNKEGGRKKIEEFNSFIEDKGEIIQNPEGSFKSAFRPTGVNTVTVVIDKPMEKENITQLTREFLESKSVEELVALKKSRYPNPDIESAMSDDEKLLDKIIAEKYSEINEVIRLKRKSQKEITIPLSTQYDLTYTGPDGSTYYFKKEGRDSYLMYNSSGVRLNKGFKSKKKDFSDFVKYWIKEKENIELVRNRHSNSDIRAALIFLYNIDRYSQELIDKYNGVSNIPEDIKQNFIKDNANERNVSLDIRSNALFGVDFDVRNSEGKIYVLDGTGKEYIYEIQTQRIGNSNEVDLKIITDGANRIVIDKFKGEIRYNGSFLRSRLKKNIDTGDIIDASKDLYLIGNYWGDFPSGANYMPSETQKEASEHAETFKKIEAGEIKTAEDLGESIAKDHKEETSMDKLTEGRLKKYLEKPVSYKGKVMTKKEYLDSTFDPSTARIGTTTDTTYLNKIQNLASKWPDASGNLEYGNGKDWLAAKLFISKRNNDQSSYDRWMSEYNKLQPSSKKYVDEKIKEIEEKVKKNRYYASDSKGELIIDKFDYLYLTSKHSPFKIKTAEDLGESIVEDHGKGLKKDLHFKFPEYNPPIDLEFYTPPIEFTGEFKLTGEYFHHSELGYRIPGELVYSDGKIQVRIKEAKKWIEVSVREIMPEGYKDMSNIPTSTTHLDLEIFENVVDLEKYLIGIKDKFSYVYKTVDDLVEKDLVSNINKLEEIEEPFSDCLHRHGINLEKDHHRFEVDTELRDLKTNKAFKVVSIGDFITLREVPAFKNALTEPDFSVSYNELIDKFRAGELQVSGFMDTEVMEFARILNTIQHCWKMDQLHKENERIREQAEELRESKIEALLNRSIEVYDQADQETKRRLVKQVEGQLKVHDSGMENIGMGLDFEMVEAGRRFLEYVKESKPISKFSIGDEGMFQGGEVKITGFDDIGNVELVRPDGKELKVSIEQFDESFALFPNIDMGEVDSMIPFISDNESEYSFQFQKEGRQNKMNRIEAYKFMKRKGLGKEDIISIDSGFGPDSKKVWNKYDTVELPSKYTEIKEAIEGLETLLLVTTGKKKKAEIQEAIEGLQVLLEIS